MPTTSIYPLTRQLNGRLWMLYLSGLFIFGNHSIFCVTESAIPHLEYFLQSDNSLVITSFPHSAIFYFKEQIMLLKKNYHFALGEFYDFALGYIVKHSISETF